MHHLVFLNANQFLSPGPHHSKPLIVRIFTTPTLFQSAVGHFMPTATAISGAQSTSISSYIFHIFHDQLSLGCLCSLPSFFWSHLGVKKVLDKIFLLLLCLDPWDPIFMGIKSVESATELEMSSGIYIPSGND